MSCKQILLYIINDLLTTGTLSLLLKLKAGQGQDQSQGQDQGQQLPESCRCQGCLDIRGAAVQLDSVTFQPVCHRGRGESVKGGRTVVAGWRAGWPHCRAPICTKHSTAHPAGQAQTSRHRTWQRPVRPQLSSSEETRCRGSFRKILSKRVKKQFLKDSYKA